MSGDFPDADMAPEPVSKVAAQTPTGQSRLAYRLAATLLLLNATLVLVVATATGTAAAPSMLVIDAALAIGLIDLRRGARALVVLRAAMGVLVTAVLVVPLLLRGELSPAQAVSGVLPQLAYAGALALLLTGQSKAWRLAVAIGLFVVGLASARLWEPFVAAGAGQTVGGTQVATNVLLAVAIAELVAATIIKQIAPQGWPARTGMYTLAVISVITMGWVAWLIGITEPVEVLVVAILWPAAAAIVFLLHGKHKTREILPHPVPSDTLTPSWTRWVPVAVSFVLALCLNALAIVLVDQETYGGQLGRTYLVLCLPVSAVILALSAWSGVKFAEGYGSDPWKGAAVGVWMGAIASIALAVWAILNGEPRIDW